MMCSEARYIGLDIHKNYMVAAGVDREQKVVLKPRRVGWEGFERWMGETLRPDDRVVLEMTVNTWEVHDQLKAHVDSVTVVHPPHVALITRAQVSTDRKSALTLARLHAAGLLVGIWVPDEHTRDLRAIIAQRAKMVRLRVQAKNRLRALLHRRQIRPPEGNNPFDAEIRDWWLSLPLSRLELARVENDLATLDFAECQRDVLEAVLGEEAARDERVPLLIQIPGVGLITAMAILGAVGRIDRFPEARKLVGYAGLGARVKASGERRTTGGSPRAGGGTCARRWWMRPTTPCSTIRTGGRSLSAWRVAWGDRGPSWPLRGSCSSSSGTCSPRARWISAGTPRPSPAPCLRTPTGRG
jgi:transposase